MIQTKITVVLMAIAVVGAIGIGLKIQSAHAQVVTNTHPNPNVPGAYGGVAAGTENNPQSGPKGCYGTTNGCPSNPADSKESSTNGDDKKGDLSSGGRG